MAFYYYLYGRYIILLHPFVLGIWKHSINLLYVLLQLVCIENSKIEEIIFDVIYY